MAIDRLATNRMGALPWFLKVKSTRLKEVLNELEKDADTKRPEGVKRAATELLTRKMIVYVDYVNKNEITGRYKSAFLHIQ